MDKFKPTYDLSSFQHSKYTITTTALLSATQLGFTGTDIQEIILSMQKKHFYKSMTSKYNHSIWQDVYHVPWDDIILYIKFTADDCISEFTLLSFKEQ